MFLSDIPSVWIINSPIVRTNLTSSLAFREVLSLLVPPNNDVQRTAQLGVDLRLHGTHDRIKINQDPTRAQKSIFIFQRTLEQQQLLHLSAQNFAMMDRTSLTGVLAQQGGNLRVIRFRQTQSGFRFGLIKLTPTASG